MSTSQDLPAVYPEFPNLSLKGEFLVVRNTFIDVEASKRESPFRRCKSAPDLPSFSAGTVEVARPRLATHGEIWLERGRQASDSFGDADVFGVAGQDVLGHMYAPEADFTCGRADCCDAELRSNASTRAPSPSTRSQRSLLSKFSSETGSSLETTSLRPIAQGSVEEEEEGVDTTFMLRNLPPSITRTKLEELFDAEGFVGAYDFLYLPVDLKAGETLGYGHINLVSPSQAERFQEHFHGHTWASGDGEAMGVFTCEVLQGQEELIARYRNSPLMHKSVPAGMRPAIYRNGALMSFPSPTVRLRPLRVRGSKKAKQPTEEVPSGRA